jgi:hypothetical protein
MRVGRQAKKITHGIGFVQLAATIPLLRLDLLLTLGIAPITAGNKLVT